MRFQPGEIRIEFKQTLCDKRILALLLILNSPNMI